MQIQLSHISLRIFTLRYTDKYVCFLTLGVGRVVKTLSLKNVLGSTIFVLDLICSERFVLNY